MSKVKIGAVTSREARGEKREADYAMRRMRVSESSRMSFHRPIRCLVSPLFSSIGCCVIPKGDPEERIQPLVTINVLPDDVLLYIFDYYVDGGLGVEAWHTLVHVCRRWRNLVFVSPRRLDSQLLCTDRTPVRELLGIWPAFPIQIQSFGSKLPKSLDNIVAALEHPDRVLQINLGNVTKPAMERFSAAMQVPSPELTHLNLWSIDVSVPVLPDAFLGGSIPHLQFLSLEGISFPSVGRLLLSASHLAFLSLWDLPHSGYVSPDAMVGCLSSLTRLETLCLGFRSPQSRPDRPSLPPPIRVIVPILAELSFRGASEYLEDLVAQIDAPLLSHFDITFFMDLIFEIPHLGRFIGRATGLNFNAAYVVLDHFSIDLKFDSPHVSKLQICCRRIDWQVSSMALVCTQLSPFLSRMEQLHLLSYYFDLAPEGKNDMESTQFLELFQPFSALRSLYVTKTLSPFVVPALQGLAGESATDVLPNLRDLFLERSDTFGFGSTGGEGRPPVLAAPQLSGHPIAVHSWERKVRDW
ncbi:hypothetical protein BC826DRAFT_1107056 [Russula brevipes]|nr:hypothetical protein BC826DRAFT_1107056 [Russula brevipes]